MDKVFCLPGIDRIYTNVGGFHLPADDGIFEAAIEPTIKEFKKAQPDYLIPVIVRVGKQLTESLKLCLRNLFILR